MKELSCDKVFFAFSKELAPALKAASGEVVRIRTKDCFGNQLRTAKDKLDEINWDNINPATGPIFVEGAKAGGALEVEIINIEVDEQSVSCTGKGEGVCGGLFSGWHTKICKIKDNLLVWNENLSIPISPMIGVIGVAPNGVPVSCGVPGTHGGNMDNKEITKGVKLTLPVAVDGALFGCGDLHAVMGDGEISVSGAEVSGWVTVKLSALPSKRLTHPLIETSSHFGVIASAKTLDDAASLAVHEMVAIVSAKTGVSEAELVMLFSLIGDVRVCQMVDPERTVRFMVEKSALKPLGFNF